jgi:hypothetical protein
MSKSTSVAGPTTKRHERHRPEVTPERAICSCRLESLEFALQISSHDKHFHVTARAIYGYATLLIPGALFAARKSRSSTRHEKQLMHCPLRLVLTGVFGTYIDVDLHI